MRDSNSLIDQLRLLIESTYDFDSGLQPLGRYVVGNRGHQRICAGHQVTEQVDSVTGARLLLREIASEKRWAAAIYLPDELIDCLERQDPRRELHAGNVDAFLTLIEEVDHLLTFAHSASRGAPVSLLELEWHAYVTQALTLSHFLGRVSGRPSLSNGQRAFLRHHVFDKHERSDGHTKDTRTDRCDLDDRYHRARRLGYRFTSDLVKRPPTQRIRRLRRFHLANHHQKLRSFAA